MKIGDLVKNKRQGRTGLVVDWTDNRWPNNNQRANHPIVLWFDGRTTWIDNQLVEIISESR